MKPAMPLAAVLLLMAAGDARGQGAFGLGEAHTLDSQVLAERRQVFVHTPPGCEPGGRSRCAVLYTLDGEAQFTHTVTTSGFLHRNGLVPPLIVIGIGTTHRTRDLTPTKGGQQRSGRRHEVPGSGGGERFLDFVERELIPWVEARYPTHPLRVFAGHSFGGLTVLHALATRPHLFKAWIAVAPTLLWNGGEPTRDLRALLASRPELAHTLFVATAVEGAEMASAAGDLRKALKDRTPRAFRWDIRHFAEDDHGSVVLPAHHQGLRFVFDGWSLPRDPHTGAVSVHTFRGVQKHYAELRGRLGFEAAPPEAVLNFLGYRKLAAGDPAEALRFLEWSARYYPESANARDSLGEALLGAGRLEEARARFREAVEMGRARRDPNLAAYERHLQAVEAKLSPP